MSDRLFNFFSKKKPPLREPSSTDLAMKIIEKELDLEKSFDPKTIHELMSLYTKMIELYEQDGNPKFYDFQERMHKMLIKPQVISALQKLNCPDPISSDPKTCPEPDRKKQAEQTRKNLSIELNKTLSFSKPGKNAEIIINRLTASSRESAHRAFSDFQSQDEALERRLASRKMSQLTKSLSFATFIPDQMKPFTDEASYLEENISTKSSFFVGDELKEELIETYKKKLEEIMEKNYSERAAKVAEIKFRYESQMADISGMGDLQDILLAQMKVNMKEEVEIIVREFEIRRKQETQRLKDEMIS